MLDVGPIDDQVAVEVGGEVEAHGLIEVGPVRGPVGDEDVVVLGEDVIDVRGVDDTVGPRWAVTATDARGRADQVAGAVARGVGLAGGEGGVEEVVVASGGGGPGGVHGDEAVHAVEVSVGQVETIGEVADIDGVERSVAVEVAEHLDDGLLARARGAAGGVPARVAGAVALGVGLHHLGHVAGIAGAVAAKVAGDLVAAVEHAAVGDGHIGSADRPLADVVEAVEHAVAVGRARGAGRHAPARGLVERGEGRVVVNVVRQRVLLHAVVLARVGDHLGVVAVEVQAVEGGQQQELAGGELTGHAEVAGITGDVRGRVDAAGDVVHVRRGVGVGHRGRHPRGQARFGVGGVEEAVAVEVGEGLVDLTDAVAVEIDERIEGADPPLAAEGGGVGKRIADGGEHRLPADEPAVVGVVDDVLGGGAYVLGAAVEIVLDIRNLERPGGKPRPRAGSGNASLGADIPDAQAYVAESGFHAAVAALVGRREGCSEGVVVGGGRQAADVVADTPRRVHPDAVHKGVASPRAHIAGHHDEVLPRGRASGREEVLQFGHGGAPHGGAGVDHRRDGCEGQGGVEDRVRVRGAGVVGVEEVAAVEVGECAGQVAEPGGTERTGARENRVLAIARISRGPVPLRLAVLSHRERGGYVQRRHIDFEEAARGGAGRSVDRLVHRVGGQRRTTGIAGVVQSRGGVLVAAGDVQHAVVIGEGGSPIDHRRAARAADPQGTGGGVVPGRAAAAPVQCEFDESVDRTDHAVLHTPDLRGVGGSGGGELLDAGEEVARHPVAVHVDEIVGRGVGPHVVLEQRCAAHVDQAGLCRGDTAARPRGRRHPRCTILRHSNPLCSVPARGGPPSTIEHTTDRRNKEARRLDTIRTRPVRDPHAIRAHRERPGKGTLAKSHAVGRPIDPRREHGFRRGRIALSPKVHDRVY